MKKIFFSLLFVFAVILSTNAQSLSNVRGLVLDNYSKEPIPKVSISIMGTNIRQLTDSSGNFKILNIPIGEQLIQIQLKGYRSQNLPITIVEGQSLNLGEIALFVAVIERNDLSVISLSDEELSDDEGGADNTAGLLQSSKDIFLSTAAYEFSSTFFRARGYNSENGKVLINGIQMNKMYNGRPQWSNWGGLNDLQRNQELSNGLAPAESTFGESQGQTIL